jgi:hypothetical protein
MKKIPVLCVVLLITCALNAEPLIPLADLSEAAAFSLDNGAMAFEDGGLSVTTRRDETAVLEIRDFLPEGMAAACGGGALIEVVNRGAAACGITITLNGSAEGRTVRFRREKRLAPGEKAALPLYTWHNGAGPYWGMQGIPVYGPVTSTGMASLQLGEPDTLKSLRITVEAGESGAAFRIDGIFAFEKSAPEGRLVPHPFIDCFGQYMHADWPGKVHSLEELKAAGAAEAEMLAEAPELPGRDTYGGWAEGPQLEATGFFRKEKVRGKWWLITPEGHLFFSMGVACVRRGDSTFITGRDDWFDWLPEADGPFGNFRGQRGSAHSRAEAIGGSGETANFYSINLKRKYGEDWEAQSRQRAVARLRAWGFNTLGNWSASDILRKSTVPFTVTGHSAGARPIEGSSGYWRKMKDVFDPQFEAATRESIRKAMESWRDDPRVIGIFVDNEESWNNLAPGVLASTPDQPARRAFITDLKTKYGSLEKLNSAWETDATSWDALRPPRRRTDASAADADAFAYRFAARYFRIVSEAVDAVAPNHLYLGCRFATAVMPKAAVQACADYADAISINAYRFEIPPKMLVEFDAPVIIGEYHFGALDRGMFHTGLVGTADQETRAEAYRNYVESVAANPVFAGCHWFQYMDQPVTGRAYDGENFNIGLVNGSDIPYAELIEAARDIHARLYRERYGADDRSQ